MTVSAPNTGTAHPLVETGMELQDLVLISSKLIVVDAVRNTVSLLLEHAKNTAEKPGERVGLDQVAVKKVRQLVDAIITMDRVLAPHTDIIENLTATRGHLEVILQQVPPTPPPSSSVQAQFIAPSPVNLATPERPFSIGENVFSKPPSAPPNDGEYARYLPAVQARHGAPLDTPDDDDLPLEPAMEEDSLPDFIEPAAEEEPFGDIEPVVVLGVNDGTLIPPPVQVRSITTPPTAPAVPTRPTAPAVPAPTVAPTQPAQPAVPTGTASTGPAAPTQSAAPSAPSARPAQPAPTPAAAPARPPAAPAPTVAAVPAPATTSTGPAVRNVTRLFATGEVDKLVKSVLDDPNRYDSEKDPVSRAIESLMNHYKDEIDLAALKAFLNKPDKRINPAIAKLSNGDFGDLPAEIMDAETRAEIATLPKGDPHAFKIIQDRVAVVIEKIDLEIQGKTDGIKDIDVQIAAIDAQIAALLRAGNTTIPKDLSDEKNRLNKKKAGVYAEINVLREGGEEEVIQPGGTVLKKQVTGKRKIAEWAATAKTAGESKVGKRRYNSPYEVLAMISIFVKKQKGKEINFLDVAKEIDHVVAQNRTITDRQKRKVNVNFVKPTLTATLIHLAKNAPEFKGVTEAQMKTLIGCKKGEEVERWVKALEGDEASHYEKTVPHLIAYLEFALRDDKTCRLNTFKSQKKTGQLVELLRQAQRSHVKTKLKDKVEGMSDADAAIAQFRELERVSINKTKITQKLITRFSKVTVAKKLGGTLGVAGAGVGLTLAAVMAPIITVLTAVPGGLKALSVLNKNKTAKKGLSEAAGRTGLGLAAGIGTHVGLSVAAVSLGVAALAPYAVIPALIAGGAGLFGKEIGKGLWKNKGKIAKGTAKGAGSVLKKAAPVAAVGLGALGVVALAGLTGGLSLVPKAIRGIRG